MDREIVISLKTIAVAFAAALGIYILYQIQPIIFILVVALIVVISAEHPIKLIMRQKVMNKPVSRSVAVVLVYFTLTTVLLFIIISTVGLPPIVEQARRIVSSFSSSLRIPNMEDGVSLTYLVQELSSISTGVISTLTSIFSGIAGVLSVLILSIYMSLDWENIKKRFLALFQGKLKTEIAETIDEIEVSIGHWVKGQLLLMVVIGLMSFAGLVVLQVDYPVALGMIAGALEIVPMLGPLVALIIAGIVAFSDSVAKGIAVIALFTVIQQIENNFLVPKVMHKVSGFSPLVILLALLVGAKLFGVIGAILAVPIMMISVIVIKRVVKYSR